MALSSKVFFFLFFFSVVSATIHEFDPDIEVWTEDADGFVHFEPSIQCVPDPSSYRECFPLWSKIRCRNKECLSVTYWSSAMEPPEVVLVDWIIPLNISCFPHIKKNNSPYHCRLVYKEDTESQTLIDLRARTLRAQQVTFLFCVIMIVIVNILCIACAFQYCSCSWFKRQSLVTLPTTCR